MDEEENTFETKNPDILRQDVVGFLKRDDSSRILPRKTDAGCESRKR